MKTIKILPAILFLLFCQISSAGQYLGGRIEYDFIGQSPVSYKYQITIYTYTKTSSIMGDRPSLDSVYFGDGSPAAVFLRTQRLDLPDNISINVYVNTHTYSGSGSYAIHFSVPSFIGGIENLPASGSVPLYLETTLVINSFICNYSSPHLLSHPIFVTPLGKDFVLSRTAYSPSWDSLSYEIGTGISPGYIFPTGVSFNNVSGEFKWKGDSMSLAGDYLFLIRIRAWKTGVLISDMMENFIISLSTGIDTTYNFITTSFPPNLTSTILPNNQFNLHVEYYDSSITPAVAFNSEFFNPAMFTSTTNNHVMTGDFIWTPTDQDVRNSPYVLQFRGKKDLTYTIYVDGPFSDTCRSTIGISENEMNAEGIFIFPNPVSDELNFVFREKKYNDVRITVYDMTGKSVLEKILITDNKTNVSHLQSGFYILKLESDNNVFYQKITKI